MSEVAGPGRQSRQVTILGWLVAITFIILLWNIVQMPRTALDQREFLHAFHYSLGLIVSLLAALRIYWWFTKPAPEPPTGLPEASFGFNRAILFALLLVFAVESIIGFGYAWGAGHEVSLFGLHLPAMIAKSEPMRMSMGYFHSALGFYYLILFAIWFAFGLYQRFRYHVGMKRLLPGSCI